MQKLSKFKEQEFTEIAKEIKIKSEPKVYFFSFILLFEVELEV